MKEYIGFKNCKVSLFNRDGHKFSQDVGDSGSIFRPVGYLHEVSVMIEQTVPSGQSIFSHFKLRPVASIKENTVQKEFTP